MQRTNMSFAIVCMVNSTAVLELESSNIANSTTLNQNCVGDIEEKNSVKYTFNIDKTITSLKFYKILKRVKENLFG